MSSLVPADLCVLDVFIYGQRFRSDGLCVREKIKTRTSETFRRFPIQDSTLQVTPPPKMFTIFKMALEIRQVNALARMHKERNRALAMTYILYQARTSPAKPSALDNSALLGTML